MPHSRTPSPLEHWTRIRLAHDAQLAVRFATWYERLATLPRPVRRWLGRSLKRKLAMTLAAAALLIALSGMPAYAASITVDPGASGINPGDGCSLVEAIINANDNAATYAECVAGTGDDTITLPSSATLNYTTPYGTNAALPNVTDTLTIEGSDSTIQRDGTAPEFRILNIYGGDFVLNHATITGGDVSEPLSDDGGGILTDGGGATIRYSTISDNTAVFGGGIAAYDGPITVEHSTVSGNTARVGGGGVANSYGSPLVLTYSTVSGNTAFGGGGILIAYDATIANSTITGNYAYYGGGILNYSLYGTLTLTNSTVSGNHADGTDTQPALGGGILNSIGVLLINRSTIADNHADLYGGGIFNGPFSTKKLAVSTTSGAEGAKANRHASRNGKGMDHSAPPQTAKGKALLARLQRSAGKGKRGGERRANIHAPNGPTGDPYGVALINSTVSGNTSDIGAGLYNYFYLALANTTVTNNTATSYGGGISNGGALIMQRSLISGNTAPQYSEVDSCGCYGVIANDYNLMGDDSKTNAQAFYNFTPGATDIIATSDGTNPTALASILNTTLGNNGGPTQTHALVANSPAIDKAPNDECTAFPIDGVDQRFFSRNADGGGGPSTNECDIGAYEYASSTAANVSPLRGRIGKSGNVNLRWQSTSETQIAGFNVYRRNGKGQFKQINRKLLQAKHPGTPAGAKYHFKDKDIKPGKTYRYKIQVLYLDNHTEWTSVIKIKR